MIELHHATIVLGKESKDFVYEILKNNLNFEIQRNPDFMLWESDSFGVDDARNLEVWSIGKPLVGEVKVSLIISKAITHEAQNALLKVLEEPKLGTYFFINIESLGNILPTFLSRVRVLKTEQVEAEASIEKLSSKFIESKLPERLTMIRSLSKKEARPTESFGQDKNIMKEVIKDLENVAYEKKELKNNMGKILTAKTFASLRGSSPKMILEWLATML